MVVIAAPYCHVKRFSFCISFIDAEKVVVIFIELHFSLILVHYWIKVIVVFYSAFVHTRNLKLSMVWNKNNVFVTNGSKKNDGELASTSFCAEFRCGSCGMGLGGSLPSSKNRFSTKRVGIEEPVGRNGGQKT